MNIFYKSLALYQNLFQSFTEELSLCSVNYSSLPPPRLSVRQFLRSTVVDKFETPPGDHIPAHPDGRDGANGGKLLKEHRLCHLKISLAF